MIHTVGGCCARTSSSSSGSSGGGGGNGSSGGGGGRSESSARNDDSSYGGGGGGRSGGGSGGAVDCRVVEGKLFYEKRWYRRGQSIIVEPRQGDKYPAMISAIGESSKEKPEFKNLWYSIVKFPRLVGRYHSYLLPK